MPNSQVPVYDAHPLLDPNVTETHPEVLRHLYKQYLRIKDDPDEYNRFLAQIFHPADAHRSLAANLATAAYYLNETVGFMGELLLLLPEAARNPLSPRPEVMGCPDVLELLTLLFESRDRRVSFEAQRKLYLTKLFFDVDHSWEVQRGDEHKQYLESLFQRELFCHTVGRRDVEICFSIGADGERMEYSVGRRAPEQECWVFPLRELDYMNEGRAIKLHVYYYGCRFKREVTPAPDRPGPGLHEPDAESWPGLSHKRSASMIAKMVRKGENDPRWIDDLIGAKFIVENLFELENLKETLFDIFGGVFRVRNAIDTLTRKTDYGKLNLWSGRGYEVYKADVDILYNPEQVKLPLPYFFTTEIQLYTLESYLRTIHSEHYAGHQAMKRRQFLEGLLPHLFPEAVYGQERAGLLAAAEEHARPRPGAGRGEATRPSDGTALERHSRPAPDAAPDERSRT